MDTGISSEEVLKPKGKSAFEEIATIIASIVSAVVGWYCGLTFLLPLGLCIGIAWLLTKKSLGPKDFRIALAVQAGHALWMSIGVFLIAGGWKIVGPDILLVAIGLAWLWARPGLGPVIFLGIYQLLSMGINTRAILNTELGSVEQKALIVHIGLRVAAIGFLIAGYIQSRKQQASIALA